MNLSIIIEIFSMFKTLITKYIEDLNLFNLKQFSKILMGPKNRCMNLDEIYKLDRDYDAIINFGELKVDKKLLSYFNNLKIVCNLSIGIDNLNLNLMKSKNVFAVNCENVYTNGTADFTMGLILSITRKINSAAQYTKLGKWKNFNPGEWDGLELNNKVLGVLGYGKIGKSVAKRAKSFGMKIIFNNRTDKNNKNYRSLNNLLKESDILTIHVSLNKDSINLINRNNIHYMKENSFLINMSRGKVIEENALIESLTNNKIQGAALDVFSNEPNIPSQLIDLNNVILTPHIGGGTINGRLSALKLVEDNIIKVIKNKIPPNKI